MTKTQALEFIGMIAHMTTEEESANGFTWEDTSDSMNSLIFEARKLTGIDPGHPKLFCGECQVPMDECDCERPGECLTCGTQCDDEGICPVCGALEWAQEELRTAVTPAEIDRTTKAVNAAKDAGIDGCRKCGNALTLRDVVDGNACVDEGEGDEAGRVFVYCSEDCRETH